MFGLSTLNLALIGGLVLSVGLGAWGAYEAVSHAAVRKIELNAQKEVAAANQAQYERSVAALQKTAEEERARADNLSQVKEAVHEVPASRVCVISPTYIAFMRIMRQQHGHSGAPATAAGKSVAVPGPAPHSP